MDWAIKLRRCMFKVFKGVEQIILVKPGHGNGVKGTNHLAQGATHYSLVDAGWRFRPPGMWPCTSATKHGEGMPQHSNRSRCARIWVNLGNGFGLHDPPLYGTVRAFPEYGLNASQMGPIWPKTPDRENHAI